MSEELKIENLPGVGAATAEKLREAGFGTMMALAVATPGELVEAAGVGEAAARKLINYSRNNMDLGFASGDELLEKRNNIKKITTSSKAFDELIGGGFETGSITECFGQFGSGKCCDKDTKALYFNSSKPHLERMEDIYNKYKNKFGEKPSEDGHIVEVPPVVVMGFKDNRLGKVQAKFLYKEKVKKMYEVQTKRGRRLKVTGPHKLLSFNEGLEWRPSAILKSGDIIAYPRKIESEDNCKFDKDDAYFMGLFAAEGCKGSRITTGSEELKDWISSYVENKLEFSPTISTDKRNEVFTVNLRHASKDILGDLSDCTAGTKFVLPELLSAPEEVVASYLAGYIDGDGHLGDKGFEVTTKSEELANGISYLFLRIGISVIMKKKVVKGDYFWRLSVASDDCKKLNDLPYKIKSSNYTPRNSSFGYPDQIVDYLKKSYKQTLGGNRGRCKKILGKINNRHQHFYNHLTNNTKDNMTMNEKTLVEINEFFSKGKKNIEEAKKLAENLENLSKEDLMKLRDLLPFAFNSFSEELGLAKPTFSNYKQRGVPKKDKGTILKIKEQLLKKLNDIDSGLKHTLATIKNVAYFNWDVIENVQEIDYDDYVYDFVVPEGHCFVGGNMPTMLHNTVVAHQLAINALDIDEEGEPQYYTVWIDTENTFRPERIKEICENKGYDPMKVLSRIKVVRAFNSDHQMMCAEKVEDLITKENLKVNLVIVDSLMAHFRAEFVGRGTLAERQQKLNKHMHILMKLADVQNLCVYVTNQVMAKPDMFFGDPTAAIGGNIVGHNSATRLYLRRGKKGTRVAKLVDSPHLPDGEALWTITNNGIEDA